MPILTPFCPNFEFFKNIYYRVQKNYLTKRCSSRKRYWDRKNKSYNVPWKCPQKKLFSNPWQQTNFSPRIPDRSWDAFPRIWTLRRPQVSQQRIFWRGQGDSYSRSTLDSTMAPRKSEIHCRKLSVFGVHFHIKYHTILWAWLYIKSFSAAAPSTAFLL